MNQRINQLAIQAGGIWQGGYVDNHAGDGVWTEHKFVHGGDMDVEQFARLLVKEFCDVVDYDNARAIVNHLGVEEK
jgi:hypothetical protein